MVTLKSKVIKSQLMRELKKEAQYQYNGYYERDLHIEAFLDGVKALFEKLKVRPIEDELEELAKEIPQEEWDNLEKGD